MDKATLDAASRLIDAALSDLRMPADVTEALRRLATQILGALAELNPAPATPPGPTLIEEMTEASLRSSVNINGVANMVMRSGVPASSVRDLVRAHLLGQTASEQRLVFNLLELVPQPRSRRGDLH
jgi:hypothetical protein